MNRAFKELFGPMGADEGLKDKTRAFLAERTRNYSAAPAGKRRYPVYAAACACMLLMLLGGRWLYFTPTAEISIDINPSIELSVNRFDRVIAVTGFNEDGLALSNALDVKYKNYEEAVEQVIQNDQIAALLSNDEVMSITVVSSDRQQSIKILSDVERCTAEHSNTYCHSARSEEVAEAHESGLSCGKYKAFLELRRLDPDITPEMVQGMTMREIWELIDSLSAAAGEDSPYSSWGDGHHGHGGGHGGGHGNGWGSRGTAQQDTEN